MSLRYRIYNLIEPRKENPISRAYDWLMLIAIAVGIFPLMFREHYRIFFYFDVFSGFCFIIDYILRWITADIRSGKQRAADFLIYPFTPMAIVDLLSILPTINLLNPTFKVMRVSRLLKLLRVIKVIRYYEPLEIIMAVASPSTVGLVPMISSSQSSCSSRACSSSAVSRQPISTGRWFPMSVLASLSTTSTG